MEVGLPNGEAAGRTPSGHPNLKRVIGEVAALLPRGITARSNLATVSRGVAMTGISTSRLLSTRMAFGKSIPRK
jgi:hypothetical protein